MEISRDRLKEAALITLAVIGFGLHQGSRMLDSGSGPYSAEAFAVVGIAAGGAACLYVAALAYLGKACSAAPFFAMGVVCTIARFVLAETLPPSTGAILVEQALGGIGWTLVILCWMEVFSGYRPSFSLPMIAGGFVILISIVPIASPLNEDARKLLLFALLFASFVALGLCLKNHAWVAKRMIEKHRPRGSIDELTRRVKRSIVAAAVFSATCGFIIEFDIISSVHSHQTALTGIIGGAVATVLFIWTVTARVTRIDLDFAYPLCAIALTAIITMRIVAPESADLSASLVTIALHTFFCLMWMAFTGRAHERKLPGFYLLGLAVGVSQISIACGRTLGGVFMQATPFDTAQYAAMAIGMLSVGTALLFVVLARQTARHGAETGYAPTQAPRSAETDAENESRPNPSRKSKPEQETKPLDAPAPAAPLENNPALDLVARRFALSKREKQIVGEFSTGRSARSIADNNLISEHTVKTHLKHAYAKMEVHSRQELLDLLESGEAELRRKESGK